MAKNIKRKKPNFGGMADETITTPEADTHTVTDTQEQEFTDTPTPTPAITEEPEKKQYARTPTVTHTPKYAPAHLPTIGSGERKTERLQLVVRPSTKSRLAAYARDHGTSSNEVVQRLLDELLNDAGY
jgi:hypothetical protein